MDIKITSGSMNNNDGSIALNGEVVPPMEDDGKGGQRIVPGTVVVGGNVTLRYDDLEAYTKAGAVLGAIITV